MVYTYGTFLYLFHNVASVNIIYNTTSTAKDTFIGGI